MRRGAVQRFGPAHVALAAAAMFLSVVYFVPLIDVLGRSTTDGFAPLRIAIESDVNRNVLWRTIVFALKVTAITLLIGYPVAYAAVRGSSRVRWVLLACATVPLWTSLLVRTFAWDALLGRRGVINGALSSLGVIDEPLRLSHNAFGALISSVYVVAPYMVLTLYASFRQIDLRLLAASRTLGASRGQAFLAVFLPLSAGAVASACLLVFILSIGFFITPALLGGPTDGTFAILIAQQIQTTANFEAAAAMSVLLLGVTFALVAVFAALAGFEQFFGGTGRTGVSRAMSRLQLALWWGRLGPVAKLLESALLWRVAVVAIAAYFILPLVVILPMSLSGADYLSIALDDLSTRWYSEVTASDQWRSAGVTSLVVAAGATVLAVVVGVAASLGLRRTGGLSGKLAVAFFLAPAVLPVIVYSVAAYFAAARVKLVDTTTALVLTNAALAVPFVVIVVATALSAVRGDLESAARSLGARPWQVTSRITLPLIAPGIAAAAVLAFQTSFDEVVVALFLSGVETTTIPKEMWQASTLQVDPAIMAVGVLVLITTAVVALAGGLARRGWAGTGTQTVAGPRRTPAARAIHPRPDRDAPRMTPPILELHAGRLLALQNHYPVDGRVSWHPPAVRGRAAANCYVLSEGGRVLIVEAGLAVHEADLMDQLRACVPGDAQVDILLLRQGEFTSIGSLEQIIRTFGVGSIFNNEFVEPAQWADVQPGRGGLAAEALARPTSIVAHPDAPIELGPDRELILLRPELRLLGTLWVYDAATRTLFTSDSFGHRLQDAGGPDSVVTEGSVATTADELRDHLLATRYWWLAGADLAPIRRWVSSVFAEHDVETIAPSFGSIFRGRSVVQHEVELLDAVLADVSGPALPEQQRPLPHGAV